MLFTGIDMVKKIAFDRLLIESYQIIPSAN